MKVLFAVSNENISSAIIKRYPKEYREILSYKNVYYFNAILKEIQKDKSYDRIVISEDLEPFVNTNHDSIDNFIFEHLDRISDEAHDNEGKETSIILICSERRSPGSSILNKLFSIGIYNAVMGKDRNLTELCKLINRPRTKKEAKIYYRIEQANYDPVVENEVNEVEIQNILAHFKKLGKNTERYADSFNNIAAQYTDEQLKIIINVLPIKVKAVLESESPKYQALMGTMGSSNSINQNANVDTGISVNTIGKSGNISGPIVIPTGVKKAQPRQVVTSPVQSQRPTPVQQPQQVQQPQVKANVNQQAQPVRQQSQVQTQISQQQRRPIQTANQQQPNVQQKQVVQQPVQQSVAQQAQPKVAPVQPVQPIQQPVQPVEEPVQVSTAVPNTTPAQVEIPKVAVEEKPKRGRGRPRKNPVVEEPQVENNDLNNLLNEVTQNNLEGNPDDSLLPGFEDTPEDGTLPGIEEDSTDNLLPGMEEMPEEEPTIPGLDAITDDGDFLPGFEDTQSNEVNDDNTVMPGVEEETTDDGILPGFEDAPEDGTLPGIEEDSTDNLLPGMEEMPEEEPTIPGLDAITDDGDFLPGFEDTQSNEVNDDNTVMPGVEEETTDDGILPGFEDTPEDGTLPGVDENQEEGEEIDVDSLLSDLDINDEINSLPDLESSKNVNNNVNDDFQVDDSVMQDSDEKISEDPIIPGIDETEETILPGMGFDNMQSNNNYNPTPEPKKPEIVDTIRPKINYSMSNLNSLLSKDKKIVSFVGTTKNGTSFLVNNLALMFSSTGINTAVLDMTENRNSYYIFTDSREELRNIAYTSIGKLENGYAEGIKVNKNFTVYTALPADGNKYENAEPILSTLVQNHSLILIDCDFQTPPAYFASSQEIYLVQSMDILTIQPLTAFLRELKFKGAWEPEKARVVINKETKIKALNEKMIIAGMSRYNGPDMSVMTDLFNKDMVKACSIPFDESVYAKYLETMATCKLSLSGYSKPFLQKMKVLQDMVYPRLGSQKTYSPMDGANNPGMGNNNMFSNNMNNTLNQMKNKY